MSDIKITLEDLPPAINIYDADIFVMDQIGGDGYTKKIRFSTLRESLSNSVNFVRKTGDEMSGPLFLSTSSPVSALQAASKGYVDTFVLKAGSTMTGALYLNTSSPTTALQSASKGYVDGKFLPLSGGVMSGAITLSSDPLSAMQVATKQYVDNSVSNVPPGAIMHFAMSAAPTGWLACNGAEIVRDTYSNLFNAIGTTFGFSTLSTFKVPDMRGEFTRTWDDGRGIDSGRVFGSYQVDAMRRIEGEAPVYAIGTFGNGTGVFAGLPVNAGGNGTGAAAYPNYGLRFDTQLALPSNTASEFRPRNIALYACIKY